MAEDEGEELGRLSAGWIPDEGDVRVTTVSFGFDTVIIDYAETRHVAADSMTLAQTHLSHRLIEKDDYEEMMATLREWVDAALRDQREYHAKQR